MSVVINSNFSIDNYRSLYRDIQPKNLSISAKVAEIATGYLLPYFITAFVLPVFLVFRTTFEGMGNTKPILIFNCIAFAINALLDYMLVFGKFGAPNMGGIGAAWATTFAYSFLLIAMIFYAKLSRGNKLLNLFSNFKNQNLIKSNARLI